MSKGANDRSGVFFEGGFNVFGGDDTFWNNITTTSVNALRFERSGDTIFNVQNYGELALKSVTGASTAALDIQGLTGQDFLSITDHETSDHVLTVRRLTSGSGWLTDLKLRDSGAPSNDDIALRVTHDIQTNSPPLGADLLSLGYTNATEVYQELFAMKQSGDLYLQGSSGADLLWGTTGGGNIGSSGGNSPGNIYANSTVNASGSVLKTLALDLGPIGATNKTITALQTGTDDPGIRYNNGTSTWQASNNGTDWTNFYLGAGNNLDEAYDAFAGAGTVTIDAGSLTWRLSGIHNFILDDGTNNYLNVENQTGAVLLASKPTASTTLQIQSLGTNSVLDIDAYSVISIDSSNGGIQLNGAATSEFKCSSGNMALGATGGNTTIASANFTVTNTGDCTISSGTGVGDALTMSGGNGGSIFESVNSGTCQLRADTTSSLAHLTIASGGNTTVNCGRHLNLNVGTAAYDMTLFVPTHASSDIQFSVHGSGNIPFNAAAPDNVLVGFTATSVIGAINELKASPPVPTWDEIYAGSQALTIDGAALTFEQTSTTGVGFEITRDLALASTDNPIVQILNENAGDDNAALMTVTYSADAPALVALSTGAPTATTGVVTSAFWATAAATASDVSLYYASCSFNAGDTAGATYRGFYADGDNAGSANYYGFSADADWDYGLHSLAPVLIEQSSTSGYTLYVHRNLAAASTDAPVVQIYNEGADDQACLKAQSEIADTITSDVVYAIAQASAIKTSGITSVFRAEITPHASDAGGAYYGFHADGSTDGGAESKVGYYADADWYLGVYSLSPGRFKYTTTASITSGVLAAQTTVPAAAAHDMVGVSSTISVGAAASGGLIAYAAETSSAGTSGPVVGYKADMTAHTNDTSTYTGFQALLGGTTSGLSFSYGFGADNSWGYGVYSESPVATALSISAAATANYIEVTSTGTGGGATVDLLKLLYVEDSGDAATVNGIKIELTPDPGANTKNGVLVDNNWTYGLYSSSPGYINRSALTASDDGFSVIATSGGISTGAQIVNLIDLSFTEHSGDSGSPKVNGINIALTPDGASTAATTGIKIDSDWDLGISSQSPGNFSRTSLTDDYDALAISISSGGLGSTPPKTVQLIDLAFAEHTDDRIANIFGINIALTPEALATNDKRAINVDDNWSYGFYSQSIVEVNLTKSDNNPWTLATLDFNSGGRASGPTTVGLLIDFNSHTSDTGDYTGIDLNYDGDASAPGNVIAIDVSTAWDYGLYSRSNVAVKETGLTADNSSLYVDFTSGGITSASTDLYGIEILATTHASDSAGNIAGVRVNNLTYLGALTSSRGVSVGSGWDYGVYSRSQIVAITGPSAGTGSLEYWAVESVPAAPSAGLLQNDELAAFKATITDDSDDEDQSVHYYGLYVTTTDTGPASKRGIFFDSTWPADHYATWVDSGLHFWQEDFGTITANTAYVDANLSGLLNSSNEGRCISLSITPDSSQADGSRWIGVRANMTNVNANDTIGSIAFEANANWHYGMYVDNDLSVQQAINEGTIHVESTSSSLVASGTYYGNSYYHTRHASDSGGSLYCFHAQTDTTGLLSVRGFEAGTNLNFGFVSWSERSVFLRGASDWTSSVNPVVSISNTNASNALAALSLSSTNTGASAAALSISHAYAGGSTEDTRRAIVFASAKTNKRIIPLVLWKPNASSVTTADWQYHSYSSGATHYQRYVTTTSTEKYISMPLVLPHNCVIKSAEVYVYHASTSTTAANFKLLRHGLTTGQGTEEATVTASTASGTQTVTLSGLSVTVNNTANSYYLMYKCGAHAAPSANYIYSAFVTYEIVDFAAGCGW